MKKKTIFQEHLFLTFGLAISIFIAMSYIILEIFFKINNNILNVLSQISVGYIINFLFFLTQIYLPRKQKYEEAFNNNKLDLLNIKKSIANIISIVTSLVKIEGGFISYKNGEIYVKEADTFSFLEIESEINSNIKIIEDCIRNLNKNVLFLQCNEYIITMISKLQSNQFIDNIQFSINARKEELYICVPEIINNFEQFKEILHDFCFIFNENEELIEYRELNEEEKIFYLKNKQEKYDSMKFALEKINGRVYDKVDNKYIRIQ